MKTFGIASICGLMMALSCHNNDNTNGRRTDTANVIHTLFSSKDITTVWVKEKNWPDTIYILKSKNFNSAWPDILNNIPVKYIEDNQAARLLNKPWETKNDHRWRYLIPHIEFNEDSANVSIYNFNLLMDIRFRLVKEHAEWKIKQRRVYIE